MAVNQGTTAFEWSNFYRSALTSDITSSATDIFLDAVPSAAEGILIIDPDSSANREIIFYSSKTATKVTCPSAALGRGYDTTTAVTHTGGTAVIMAPVGDMFRMLKNLTVTPDDAVKPKHLASGAGTTWAWQAWTPTWTNMTVGNGVMLAYYNQIGKTVFARLDFTFGTTSTMGSFPYFTLPVTAHANYGTSDNGMVHQASVSLINAATTYNVGMLMQRTSTTAIIRYLNDTSTLIDIHSGTPFAWGNDDKISIKFTYEAA